MVRVDGRGSDSLIKVRGLDKKYKRGGEDVDSRRNFEQHGALNQRQEVDHRRLSAQAAAQSAANGTSTYTASVKQSEDFTVKRTITFSGGATTCSPGAAFVVNVTVYQQQTNRFLARSDSVVTC